MPKLAANLSFLFNEVDFLERFEAAARAGFKGVEYLFPYAWPAEEIAERLARHQLTQALFNLPPGNWDAGDRGIAAQPGREGEFQDSVGAGIAYIRFCSICSTIRATTAGSVANTAPRPLARTGSAGPVLTASASDSGGLSR